MRNGAIDRDAEDSESGQRTEEAKQSSGLDGTFAGQIDHGAAPSGLDPVGQCKIGRNADDTGDLKTANEEVEFAPITLARR